MSNQAISTRNTRGKKREFLLVICAVQLVQAEQMSAQTVVKFRFWIVWVMQLFTIALQ